MPILEFPESLIIILLAAPFCTKPILDLAVGEITDGFSTYFFCTAMFVEADEEVLHVADVTNLPFRCKKLPDNF